MICDLEHGFGASSHNGRLRVAFTDKTPERSPYELLAWAILEQAVDDLVTYCRYGIVTTDGRCLPWPAERHFQQGYWVRLPKTIAASRGPFDHAQLCAWFLSAEADTFCDLIGCKLPAAEIFWSTVKHHGGLPQ